MVRINFLCPTSCFRTNHDFQRKKECGLSHLDWSDETEVPNSPRKDKGSSRKFPCRVSRLLTWTLGWEYMASFLHRQTQVLYNWFFFFSGVSTSPFPSYNIYYENVWRSPFCTTWPKTKEFWRKQIFQDLVTTMKWTEMHQLSPSPSDISMFNKVSSNEEKCWLFFFPVHYLVTLQEEERWANIGNDLENIYLYLLIQQRKVL